MTWHTRGRTFSQALLASLVVYCSLATCLQRAWGATDPAVLLAQGQAALQRGAFEEAIFARLAAARLYEANPPAQAETLQRLAYAYSALGHYRQAQHHLTTALALARQHQHPYQEALLLGHLGNLLLTTGARSEAEPALRRALQLARTLEQTELVASMLNNLGNVWTAREAHATALEAYLESQHLAQQTGAAALRSRAVTNAARAAQQQGNVSQVQTCLDQALLIARQLLASHDTAYDLISLGLAYKVLSTLMPESALTLQAATALHEAWRTGQALEDKRAVSYASGYLGSLYEAEQRYEEAMRLTEQALFAAQQVQAPESLYRWQWQRARLLQAQGQREESIGAYRQAVQTLQAFRQEVNWSYGRGRLSFRAAVEPVYFGLGDLLLQRAATLQDPARAEPCLWEAQEAVELFKTAELQDYFQDNCVHAVQTTVSLETLSKAAVIIYPIILPDRLELLLRLPDGLRRVRVAVDAQTLRENALAFRHFLEKRPTREFLPYAEKFYHWLIRPLEAQLATTTIDTLVFVLDGPLRNLPMAALFDGRQYLILKYALAVPPGLHLTNPRPLSRDNLRILAVGLSAAVQGFDALPFVPYALKRIEQLYEGTTLLDATFLHHTVEQQLREHPFRIVHIASHGQFRGNLSDTFLLTFDGRLTLDHLENMIRPLRFRDEPLELLTFSACQTVAGDDRAALGLAGVAVKAGARSALATLWYISDQASMDLIAEFYRHLRNPGLSRAAALQQAQLAILQQQRYTHPGYWAPFLLINNWL